MSCLMTPALMLLTPGRHPSLHAFPPDQRPALVIASQAELAGASEGRPVGASVVSRRRAALTLTRTVSGERSRHTRVTRQVCVGRPRPLPVAPGRRRVPAGRGGRRAASSGCGRVCEGVGYVEVQGLCQQCWPWQSPVYLRCVCYAR